MMETKFEGRVNAFANYYSQNIYDNLDFKTFMYDKPESIKIIKTFMLIFLEQCITNVTLIDKET